MTARGAALVALPVAVLSLAVAGSLVRAAL